MVLGFRPVLFDPLWTKRRGKASTNMQGDMRSFRPWLVIGFSKLTFLLDSH